MSIYLKWMTVSFISVITLIVSLTVKANPLTPPHEPRDNDFYVCYAHRFTKVEICKGCIKYRKFKYEGCMISRAPCSTIPIKCKAAPHQKSPKIAMDKDAGIKQKGCLRPAMKQFYWYNNYPQALNAFYRCAYTPP